MEYAVRYKVLCEQPRDRNCAWLRLYNLRTERSRGSNCKEVRGLHSLEEAKTYTAVRAAQAACVLTFMGTGGGETGNGGGECGPAARSRWNVCIHSIRQRSLSACHSQPLSGPYGYVMLRWFNCFRSREGISGRSV